MKLREELERGKEIYGEYYDRILLASKNKITPKDFPKSSLYKGFIEKYLVKERSGFGKSIGQIIVAGKLFVTNPLEYYKIGDYLREIAFQSFSKRKE